MRNLSTLDDHCTCPVGMNRYGLMEEFHQAADEIEEAMLQNSSMSEGQ